MNPPNQAALLNRDWVPPAGLEATRQYEFYSYKKINSAHNHMSLNEGS